MRTPIVVLGAAVLLLASIPLLAPAGAEEGTLAPALIETHGEARTIAWEGESRITLAGACLPALGRCVGNSTEDGSFFLPASGHNGRIVVWWSAVNDSLRTLRIHAGGAVREGPSPIEFDLPGAEAGLYFIRPETTGLAVGAHDQRIQWAATFDVDPAAPVLEGRGVSRYATLTGCAAALCDVLAAPSGSALLVPWTAEGELVATWDAAREPRRLVIPGTDFVAEGPSPLVLRLDGLAVGRWEVHLAPTGPVAPLAEQTVEWTVALRPQ